MELIIVSFLKTMFIVAATSGTFGPHQEPAKAETVAVIGSQGQVLYHVNK